MKPQNYVRIRSHRARYLVPVLLLLISLALNLAAWKSTAFSDWFTDRIFPVYASLFGHLTSPAPFSLGERLLIVGVSWLAALLLATILLLFLRKRSGCRRFAKGFWTATLWVVSLVLLVQTFGCLIQYHCTPLENALPGYGKTYTLEDLADLRDYVVKTCNTMAQEMPRDADGKVTYAGGEAAMQKEAGKSVQALSAAYPRLGGYQVTPKPLTFSAFVSQQYMQGYYFPFSMEANYNELMEIMNKPFTMCHELSHTHGYIYEDDANFLAFLACTESDDPVFQYSGWLGILNYVDNAFYENAGKTVYRQHVSISDTVSSDNQFLSDETWKLVEGESALDTDTVKQAADTYVDTTLKANGVSSGKISYTHVVALLLEYFDGNF